jgi:branched-chain amino acid transport system substrate-binding protein
MAMTGDLAANGKSALLARRSGKRPSTPRAGWSGARLVGRPVKLIYYDDQSNPATVPGIYTKLLDVDKVDLVIGAYATAQIAPAMPIVMSKNKLFVTLLGLAVNSEFNYPNYFAMIPAGPDPKPATTKGFFDIAAAQTPKAADGGDRHSRPGAPPMAPARMPRRAASRSCTTRPIRPPPPTSPRSCAPSRRPIRTSW